MFKKFLILPIIGLFGLTAFASADDYVISDTPIPTDIVVDGHNVPIVLDSTQKSLICVAVSTVDWSTVDSNTRNNCVDTVDGNYVPKSTTVMTSNYVDFDGSYFVPFSVSNDIILRSTHSVSTGVGYSQISCTSSSPCVFKKGITYYFILSFRYYYVNVNYPYFVNSIIFDSETPDDGGLLPGSSDGSFGGGIINGVNSMLSGFGNILPDLLLFSFPILIMFLFWKYIYVFLKSVFTGRSRYSIRDDMFIDDWYDKWSNSDEGKMILAQQKVFEKELSTPGMQDKYFYTENIDKTGHYFSRYDSGSDTAEVLGKDLKWHKV